MGKFKALFGIGASQIKENCIIAPILHKGMLRGLKVENFSKGKLYASGNSDNFTLIHTGIGAAFTGDAVLYLKETACRNLVLFGSCGLVEEKNGLSIGSLVAPFKCYEYESFSAILSGRSVSPQVSYPDSHLLESFIKAGKGLSLRKSACATISSLKLEEEMSGVFVKEGIDVVDMECSAFFTAAKHIDMKPLALFFVSDILKTAPFYTDLGPSLKVKISSSLKDAAAFLYQFMKNG